MRPTCITAYLAEAHRQDLFHEAARAALAAEAQSDPVTSSLGATVLLFASDLLFTDGHRLRHRLARSPLLQTPHPSHYAASCPVVPACRYDGARSPRAACLEA